MVEVIYQKRFLARGPRVVAIGGGTGLSTLLRGLKEHTSNLTAVVTVADDGGSTGVLRTELGIPPSATSATASWRSPTPSRSWAELLQYRFPGVAGATVSTPRRRATREPPSSLGGHAVGNLLLAALVDARGRRLRGGRARDEPRARGARPGRAGDGDVDRRSTRGSTTAPR